MKVSRTVGQQLKRKWGSSSLPHPQDGRRPERLNGWSEVIREKAGEGVSHTQGDKLV